MSRTERGNGDEVLRIDAPTRAIRLGPAPFVHGRVGRAVAEELPADLTIWPLIHNTTGDDRDQHSPEWKRIRVVTTIEYFLED